jgi:hypothetical protein
MKTRLLIFANDPAGANVTMAYAKLHKAKYSTILAFCTNTSISIYQEHIQEYISDINNLKFTSSDTIITGTSGINSYYELDIIKNAKNNNVKKTIMIVDNTSNFLMRFTINNNIIEEKYLCDEIWLFKEYNSKINYLNRRLKIKENFYTKYIRKLYNQNPPNITNNFIVKNKKRYITILSEYVYELYGLEYGFTEYEVVENILNSIHIYNHNIPIYLKLHPKEHKNKYNILLRKYSNLNICTYYTNIQEIIYYSKAIFGINSSVFIESIILNIPTYSIQIDSTKIINTHTKNNIKSNKDLNTTISQLFSNLLEH